MMLTESISTSCCIGSSSYLSMSSSNSKLHDHRIYSEQASVANDITTTILMQPLGKLHSSLLKKTHILSCSATNIGYGSQLDKTPMSPHFLLHRRSMSDTDVRKVRSKASFLDVLYEQRKLKTEEKSIFHGNKKSSSQTATTSNISEDQRTSHKVHLDIGYLMIHMEDRSIRIPIELDKSRMEEKIRKHASASEGHCVLLKKDLFAHLDSELENLFSKCKWSNILSASFVQDPLKSVDQWNIPMDNMNGSYYDILNIKDRNSPVMPQLTQPPQLQNMQSTHPPYLLKGQAIKMVTTGNCIAQSTTHRNPSRVSCVKTTIKNANNLPLMTEESNPQIEEARKEFQSDQLITSNNKYCSGDEHFVVSSDPVHSMETVNSVHMRSPKNSQLDLIMQIKEALNSPNISSGNYSVSPHQIASKMLGGGCKNPGFLTPPGSSAPDTPSPDSCGNSLNLAMTEKVAASTSTLVDNRATLQPNTQYVASPKKGVSSNTFTPRTYVSPFVLSTCLQSSNSKQNTLPCTVMQSIPSNEGSVASLTNLKIPAQSRLSSAGLKRKIHDNCSPQPHDSPVRKQNTKLHRSSELAFVYPNGTTLGNKRINSSSMLVSSPSSGSTSLELNNPMHSKATMAVLQSGQNAYLMHNPPKNTFLVEKQREICFKCHFKSPTPNVNAIDLSDNLQSKPMDLSNKSPPDGLNPALITSTQMHLGVMPKISSPFINKPMESVVIDDDDPVLQNDICPPHRSTGQYVVVNPCGIKSSLKRGQRCTRCLRESQACVCPPSPPQALRNAHLECLQCIQEQQHKFALATAAAANGGFGVSGVSGVSLDQRYPHTARNARPFSCQVCAVNYNVHWQLLKHYKGKTHVCKMLDRIDGSALLQHRVKNKEVNSETLINENTGALKIIEVERLMRSLN